MEENGEQNLKDNKETESYQSIKQSTQEMEVPRVFILGAGFSAPAGLPLAQNLLDIIRAKANQQEWMKGTIDNEYERFKEYLFDSLGKKTAERRVNNIEDFISFLDVEHFLKLKGSDTWSDIGNEAQIIIRNLICKVLHEAMSNTTAEQYDLYKSFAQRLKPGDLIITFNYDTLLEQVLSNLGKHYRFHYLCSFPPPIDYDEGKDIIIFKMHGSMNWFDISHFDNFNTKLRENDLYVQPRNVIFNDNRRVFKPVKIFKYVSNPDSPLRQIYQIAKVGEYLNLSDEITICPLIISPSYTKVAYLNPLKDLWFSFNQMAIVSETLAIIGFSLPPHDDYLRIPIYRLVHNFQHVEYKGFKKKTKLKIVDLKETENEIKQFKRDYSFVNWDKTDVHFKGFDEEAIDMIFGQ